MKYLILLLLITVLFNSCDFLKNDISPKTETFGNLEGKLNGEVLAKLFPLKYQVVRANIEPSNKCKDPIGISVSLYSSKNLYSLRGSLRWDNVKTIPGKFTVNNNLDICNPNNEVRASFNSLIGGDVSDRSYHVLDTPDNFFELESYNEETKEIRGKFNVTLVIKPGSGSTDSFFSDTLRFTEGRIHTRIFN